MSVGRFYVQGMTTLGRVRGAKGNSRLSSIPRFAAKTGITNELRFLSLECPSPTTHAWTPYHPCSPILRYSWPAAKLLSGPRLSGCCQLFAAFTVHYCTRPGRDYDCGDSLWHGTLSVSTRRPGAPAPTDHQYGPAGR